MSDIKNIFADEADDNSPENEDFNIPTLNLDDESLEEETVEYVPIPVGTTTGFEVYDAQFRVSQSGNPMWNLTLRTLSNEWGPGKQIFHLLVFSDKTAKWGWGPFLKAVNHIPDGGKLSKEFLTDVEAVVGLKFNARVRGYRWKNGDTEEYETSTGKNKKPVPTQAKLDNWGVRLQEDLTNFKPLPAETEDDDLGGLAEFSSDAYL